MTPAMIKALTVLVTQSFLAVYVFLLVEFRAPSPRWQRLWAVAVGILVAGNVLWIGTGHQETYSRIGYFTLLIPYMLITLYCSQYRDARTLFGVSNASYVGCVCGMNGNIAQLLCPSVWFLPLLVRSVSLVGMFFVLRRFSRTCRVMVRQLERGWILLWMIPLSTSLISMYINARFFQATPVLVAIAVYGLLAVCAAAYYLMYLFFEQVLTKSEMAHNQKLLSLQVAGLQSRIKATDAAEERLRIDRHDLHHRLELVREMVQRGKTAEALEFVASAQQKFHDSKPLKWCKPPVLDAMFASYFGQAAAQGIRVDANLTFPEPLPVDEGELAIVLANALENAIHACMKLPEEQREVQCIVIARPNLMLQISNPCLETVQLDEHGLPVSTRAGHGIGTQSIAAFCQKYGGVYHFQQEQGLFIVRVIL